MRRVALLVLIMILAAPTAQAAKVSLGAGGGTGYMPMNEWEDFTVSGPNSDYHADDLTLYLDLFARFRLADNHAVRASYGWISRSAQWAVYTESTPIPGGASTVDYEFTTMPFGFGYEYFFAGVDAGSSAYLGLGASVYFTSLEAKVRDLGTDAPPNPEQPRTRDGQGFGVEFVVGQRAAVTEYLSIDAQVRGRWADGLMFSDDRDDVKVKFSGVDVAVFLEWLLPVTGNAR